MNACSSVPFKQILKLMERKALSNELSLEEEEEDVEEEWSGEDGHASLGVQMQIKGRHMHVVNVLLNLSPRNRSHLSALHNET